MLRKIFFLILISTGALIAQIQQTDTRTFHGNIPRDSLHYNPVIAFIDSTKANIFPVSAQHPLPVIGTFPSTDTLIIVTPTGTTGKGDSVAVANTPTTAFAGSSTALQIILINNSSINMWLNYGGTAKINSGDFLPPNATRTFGMLPGNIAWLGSISVIAASGSGNILTRQVIYR